MMCSLFSGVWHVSGIVYERRLLFLLIFHGFWRFRYIFLIGYTRVLVTPNHIRPYNAFSQLTTQDRRARQFQISPPTHTTNSKHINDQTFKLQHAHLTTWYYIRLYVYGFTCTAFTCTIPVTRTATPAPSPTEPLSSLSGADGASAPFKSSCDNPSQSNPHTAPPATLYAELLVPAVGVEVARRSRQAARVGWRKA